MSSDAPSEHREPVKRRIPGTRTADSFFGGKEPGLVNGVLDRLARELRPEAFEAPGTG